MTILSAQSIRRLCVLPVENGQLPMEGMVHPFHERTACNGLTFGLSPCGYDIRIDGDVDIYSNEFRLASSMEHFNMPDNVVGRVHDKSSWARKGLFVQNTVIEPGWSGFLTLELTMDGPMPCRIKRGTPIAQVLFEWLDEPTEQPYNGKYQNQASGPQPAIFNVNMALGK